MHSHDAATTNTQFKHSLPRLGVEVRFAQDDTPEAFASLISERTRALYVETLGNPKVGVMVVGSCPCRPRKPKSRRHSSHLFRALGPPS